MHMTGSTTTTTDSTPRVDAARESLGVDASDVTMLRRRRRQERALRVISGVIVSFASFVASYIVTRDLWWSGQDLDVTDTYPYAAVAIAAGRRLRGPALMLLVVGTISATAGAVAAIVLGEPESVSAVRYGVLARDE